MIYRVTIETGETTNYQNFEDWKKIKVVYCGTDLEAARIAYLKNLAKDDWNWVTTNTKKYRETTIVSFESEPTEIDCSDSSPVEMEAA